MPENTQNSAEYHNKRDTLIILPDNILEQEAVRIKENYKKALVLKKSELQDQKEEAKKRSAILIYQAKENEKLNPKEEGKQFGEALSKIFDNKKEIKLVVIFVEPSSLNEEQKKEFMTALKDSLESQGVKLKDNKIEYRTKQSKNVKDMRGKLKSDIKNIFPNNRRKSRGSNLRQS